MILTSGKTSLAFSILANITFLGSFFTEPPVSHSLIIATGLAIIGTLVSLLSND
jgi:hypothetical protein